MDADAFSRMAGTSEKPRSSPFILVMCFPHLPFPPPQASGGTELKMDGSSKTKATNFN